MSTISRRAFLAATTVAAVQGTARAQAPEKVTLLLNFYLYSEHAPFFLGRERGYFKDQGIDLDIQEGRGSGITVQAIAAGTAQFGYADVASMAKAAEKGAPVEAIGILLQKSPMAVIGLAEKGVTRPAELKGHSVAMTPGDSLSQLWPMFLQKVGLKPADVTVISGDVKTKLNAVIVGQSDFMLGYLMDQNMRIEKATGKKVTVLPFADYGVNLESSAVITSRDLAKAHPDLARRFMAAMTRSVEDAEKDRTAAVDAMLKAAPKAGDRADLIKGLQLTIPLYHTAETAKLPPFRASEADFAESMKLLVAYGGIDKASLDHLGDLYTTQFLPK